MWISNRERSMLVNTSLFDRCTVSVKGGEWCVLFTNEATDAWVILDSFATEDEARSYFIAVVMRRL